MSAQEEPIHWTHVQRQWNGFRISCRACDLYEQHENESTAYREADRHRLTQGAPSDRTSPLAEDAV